MKKNKIQELIKKELEAEKDYTYLVLDLRHVSPITFTAWIKNEKPCSAPLFNGDMFNEINVSKGHKFKEKGKP